MSTLYDGSLTEDGASIYWKDKLLDYVRNVTTGDAKLLVSSVRNPDISQASELFTMAVFCDKTKQDPHCHDIAREGYVVLEGKMKIAWAPKGSNKVKVKILSQGDCIVFDRFCCHMIGSYSSEGFLALTFKVPPDGVAKEKGGRAQIDCGNDCGHEQGIRESLIQAVEFS